MQTKPSMRGPHALFWEPWSARHARATHAGRRQGMPEVKIGTLHARYAPESSTSVFWRLGAGGTPSAVGASSEMAAAGSSGAATAESDFCRAINVHRCALACIQPRHAVCGPKIGCTAPIKQTQPSAKPRHDLRMASQTLPRCVSHPCHRHKSTQNYSTYHNSVETGLSRLIRSHGAARRGPRA